MHDSEIKILNNCSASLTIAALLSLVFISNLRWHMPPAQYFALITHSLEYKTETYVETKTEAIFETRNQDETLLGIPITVDDTMADSRVELRRGTEVIGRIEALAIPNAFWRTSGDSNGKD